MADNYYVDLVARIGEPEAQVLMLAYHLHKQKPDLSRDDCIAGARWIAPHLFSATSKTSKK